MEGGGDGFPITATLLNAGELNQTDRSPGADALATSEAEAH